MLLGAFLVVLLTVVVVVYFVTREGQGDVGAAV